jgi:hypothetical protein
MLRAFKTTRLAEVDGFGSTAECNCRRLLDALVKCVHTAYLVTDTLLVYVYRLVFASPFFEAFA